MKMKEKKNKFPAIIAVIIIVIVIIAVFKSMSVLEHKNSTVSAGDTEQTEQTDDVDTVYYDGKLYAQRQDLESVLIMGVDKYEDQTNDEGYSNNQQSDFIMLLVMDKTNNSYSVLHINRDTMTDIPTLDIYGDPSGSVYGQLALAHTYGKGGNDSCRNSVKAVSDYLFGVNIDHYIALTMDAVPELNDLVGGVKVKLLDDFTKYYPEMTEGSELTLNGEEALAYVRYRMDIGDSTNINRMERQRQYMLALKDKFAEKVNSDDNFMLNTIGILSDYMVSDCTADQLSSICNTCMADKDNGFVEIPGEAVKGEEYMEFYADEDELMKTVIDLFYEPYTETK